MKPLKFIIPFLLLASGCYFVKESNLVSKSRFPGSEKRLEGDYYLVKEIEKTGIENPYETVELSKASKYKYRISETYERKKTFSGGGFFASATAVSGIGGAIFANHLNWFDANTTKTQAFFSGAAVTGLVWLLVSVPFMKDATDHRIVPGYEFDYKPDKLLSNVEINIKTSLLEKKFQTDANGLLKFSPAMDFQLEKLKTNDSIQFLFQMDNFKFINEIKLQPSDWMNEYARIIVPKAALNSSYDGILGYGREGMMYKVIDKNSDKVNIQVGSKEAWVNSNNAEVYYTTNAQADLSPAIKSYVVEEMQNWIQQGEFELPDDYLKRISAKEEQLKIFTNEAMKTFQKEYVAMFDWNNSTISNYDPNSQTFKINIPSLSEIVINVPIENAKEFKNNWRQNTFKNQEFTMVNGKWELVTLQIEDRRQAYTATYNSNLSLNYDPVNQFAFDYKDFEPDLSKIPVNKEISQKLDSVDKEKYTINTNLPKTGMNQPDAIAVVIGNSFYQKAEPVNFAINDAQLMKLYLIQVLGFKEGNIVFTMNASKAEFEGLFGTDANYKGKLYNYIKPGISDVFVFYSGHGAPDPQTTEAYFVPTDCDPSYLNLQGYALKTFYSNLAKLPSKSTTVVIDACFSGDGVLKNISSVRIRPKDTKCNIPNSAILCSSAGEQVSSWYKEMKHGLFTYFFLKAIHDFENSDTNKDKQLTFNEIFDYVSDKTNGVPYFARRLNAVEQTPVIDGSATDRVLIKY